MKSNILLLSLLTAFTFSLSAQKLSTRNGYIKFFSKTPIENIEAENKQVSSVIDLSNGKFAFLVPIKAFTFEKALMQEHFNENYMESAKYPKATFQGVLLDYEKLDVSKSGEYSALMKGTMTIHGTSKEIEEKVKFYVNGGDINMTANFKLRPEDYGVEIPAAKRDNIAETVEVTVKMQYESQQ